MKKILLISLVLLALSFVLFAEKADKPMMDKNCPMNNEMGAMQGPGQGGMQDMMKELNLTKEQKVKFDAMKDEHMKFMNSKQAEMENLQIDKQNAMQAQQYDKAKLINKNISDLELVITNAMVDHKAEMLKELTPEQKAKFQEMMPMGMRGHGQGMGMKGDCKGMGKDCKDMKDGKGMGKGKGQCMDDKKGPCTGDCK